MSVQMIVKHVPLVSNGKEEGEKKQLLWPRLPTTLFVNFKENPQRKLSFQIWSYSRLRKRDEME